MDCQTKALMEFRSLQKHGCFQDQFCATPALTAPHCADKREKIIERLKHLQAQFESSLVVQARSPATHWTTTLQGQALLVWGFVSTQTQALEGILQEEESSASQLLQLFRTLMGPRKNPDAFQKLLEWVSTHPADEPLPGSLAKEMSQFSYPIRYLARFYAHRLNVRSHQLLQRLTKVLQKIEQDGQAAPRAVEPKWKGIFETRHKDRPKSVSKMF